MRIKMFVDGAYWRRSRLVFAALLSFSATASSSDHDAVVYDVVATIFGGSGIDHVDHVEVRFNNPSFYWNVGVLPEGDRARHSEVQPRKVPESLLLSWEENGERYDAPFTIKMPSADLMESTRTSGVVIDGRIVKNKLELLVEISPDSNTARVYWRVDRMPRPSRAKDGTSKLRPDAAR